MSSDDNKLASELGRRLLEFHEQDTPIPAVESDKAREVLAGQLVDSVRRVQYVHTVRKRDVSRKRADPNNPDMFDPIKAAIWHKRNGNFEEACWLVFLSTHFGKHKEGGWRYARQVYQRMGQHGIWDWDSVSSSPAAFRDWLDKNADRIQNSAEPGGFGNHRKYQSLKAYGKRGTGAAVESYVDWIDPPHTHREKFERAVDRATSRYEAFDILYQSMDDVKEFGRLGKFDYLAMIGKIGLTDISPGSTYMKGATGPLDGARLLLEDGNEDLSPSDINKVMMRLSNHLDVDMQVLEDALCNWQKSPLEFKSFRG